MVVLAGSGSIILLTASLQELIRRVQLADRPRVNVGTTVEEDIRMIWKKSGGKNYHAADVVYATDHKSIDQAVQDFKDIITDLKLKLI